MPPGWQSLTLISSAFDAPCQERSGKTRRTKGATPSPNVLKGSRASRKLRREWSVTYWPERARATGEVQSKSVILNSWGSLSHEGVMSLENAYTNVHMILCKGFQEVIQTLELPIESWSSNSNTAFINTQRRKFSSSGLSFHTLILALPICPCPPFHPIRCKIECVLSMFLFASWISQPTDTGSRVSGSDGAHANTATTPSLNCVSWRTFLSLNLAIWLLFQTRCNCRR